MAEAPKKRFRIDKKLWIVIFCLFGLTAVALSYLLVYVPDNEKYLNERRFKAIQRVKRNIDEKQQNTFQLIQTLSDSYAMENLDEELMRQYLGFRFGPGKQPEFSGASKKKAAGKKEGLLLPDTALYFPMANPAADNIGFVLQRVSEKDTVDFAMKYSATSFFSPLLPGAGFDEFVILVNKRVIYETFPSGLDTESFDTLVQVTPKLNAANTKSIMLGGTGYQAYIQPFSIGTGQDDALIIGLIHQEKYRAEKGQLPSQKIIWVITLAILIIILLPWLKLFNMGTQDRLTIWDGAFSFVVAMLLVSVIFLGFSILAIRYQPENYRNGLENLADSIEAEAGDYMSGMKVRLDNYDDLIGKIPELQQDIIFLGNNAGARAWGKGMVNTNGNFKKPDSLLNADIFNTCFDPTIFQVFWLDKKNGEEKFNWSSEQWNGPHGNYSKRKYFKGHQDPAVDYVAEQVVSWTTGTFRTLISKKSKVDSLIACISFDLKPLTDVVLPVGYGFAVVENSGEVLYHSNNVHNLNENFADETSDPDLVKNIIKSKNQRHVFTKYKGAETNLFVRPVSLNGFRYSIIVFYDQELELIKETGAFSFTLIMLFIFFLVALGQMVLVVVISSRKSKLNRISLETDWIWPRPSLKKVYDYSGYFQLVVFLVLVIIYYFCHFLSFLFVLLVAVSAITFFVNVLYRQHYLNKSLQHYVYYKNRNLLAVFIFLFGVNFFACWKLWSQPGQWMIILIFQAILFAGGYVVFHFFKIGSANWKPTGKDAKDFIKGYSRMAITRLIITSGLPVLFFYQYAYNYQQSLIAHYKHISYLERLNPDYSNSPRIGNLSSPGVYFDNYWIAGFGLSNNRPEKPTQVDSATNEMLKRFRVYNTAGSNAIDAYAVTNMADSPFAYFPPMGWFKKGEGFTSYLVPESPPYPMLRTSNNIVFHFPNFFRWPIPIAGVLYWLFFMGFIYLLYKIIIRVVRHIFALDIPGERSMGDMLSNIMSDNQANKQVFVTGLPGSGKRTFVEKVFKTAKALDGLVVIDIQAPIPENIQWDGGSKIIFNQFECVVQSKDKCVAALNLFEKIMVGSGEKPAVFLLSTIPPDRIILLIDKLYVGDPSAPSITIRERYRVLLSYFISVILPIQSHLQEDEIKERGSWATEEFRATRILDKLRQPLLDNFDNPQSVGQHTGRLNLKLWFDESQAEKNESLTWSLQNMAGPFYKHIWESLCPEERYLIYDLAEEGLVNQTNKYHLSMLIQKGLIIRKEPNGQPELINDSFRSFVLYSIDKAEALSLQNEVKGSGSWSDLGRPLTLVTLGILAILLISQKQAYVSVFGFLTAIGAAIPTLNAIFSVVKPAQPGGGK